MFRPLEAIVRSRFGILEGGLSLRWLAVQVGVDGGPRSRSSKSHKEFHTQNLLPLRKTWNSTTNTPKIALSGPRKRQLIPNYARIKVPKTSPAAKFTLHKAQNLRIKDELKYLYAKKQQLNLQIYHLHISLANTWWIPWPNVLHSIEEKLRKAMTPICKNVNSKLNKLTLVQTKTPTPPTHSSQGW